MKVVSSSGDASRVLRSHVITQAAGVSTAWLSCGAFLSCRLVRRGTYQFASASNPSVFLAHVRSAIRAWHDELEAGRQLIRQWSIEMLLINPAGILTALASRCHLFCLLWRANDMLSSLGRHRFRGDHRSFPRLAQVFRSPLDWTCRRRGLVPSYARLVRDVNHSAGPDSVAPHRSVDDYGGRNCRRGRGGCGRAGAPTQGVQTALGRPGVVR